MEIANLLRSYHKEYKNLYRLYTQSQIDWAEWNGWASTQPEYVDWLYENSLKLSDVRAKRPTDRQWGWEDGAGLYQNRHLLYHELDQIRLKRSELLRQVWFMQDENDQFTYTLEEIANILDEKDFTAMQIIKRHISWYQPRRDFKRENHPSMKEK